MTDSTDQIRLPFRRHLEWMLLEGHSHEEIVKFYDNIQFPSPSEDDFGDAQDRVDAIILPPITKRNLARNAFTAQDRAIMKKYGFEEIYLRKMNQTTLSSQWKNVGKLLSHPVMRVAIDCCLVANIEIGDLVELLPVQFNIPIDQASVELYEKYFFDHTNMDKAGWRHYLNLLIEDQYTYQRLYTALTKGKDEVLFLVGLPTKAQFGTFLKNVLATADYKFRYYARHNDPDSDIASEKWAKIGFKAGELHDKFAKGDMTDFAKLVQTEFEYVDAPLISLEPEMLGGIKPSIAHGVSANKKVDIPPPPPLPSNGVTDPDNI